MSGSTFLPFLRPAREAADRASQLKQVRSAEGQADRPRVPDQQLLA
jgi:hypothetical protein